jgi:hypothetical protein
MQRLDGDGSASSTPAARCTRSICRPGQTLRVDTGCLVALQPSVSYDIQFVGQGEDGTVRGEGLFFASLTGPGRVWLQSLPFSRMADRIYKAAPAAAAGARKEGSILGGLAACSTATTDGFVGAPPVPSPLRRRSRTQPRPSSDGVERRLARSASSRC